MGFADRRLPAPCNLPASLRGGCGASDAWGCNLQACSIVPLPLLRSGLRIEAAWAEGAASCRGFLNRFSSRLVFSALRWRSEKNGIRVLADGDGQITPVQRPPPSTLFLAAFGVALCVLNTGRMLWLLKGSWCSGCQIYPMLYTGPGQASCR